MKKTIAAIVLAITPTLANAGTPVYLDLDRMILIREAASHICKAVADERGVANEILVRRSTYLRLTPAEALYIQNLCILYLTGRSDESIR